MSTDKSKSYKGTLLLPRTDFPMKADPQAEKVIRQFWDDTDLYERVREARRGRPLRVVHDGPPYADGNIHFGHLLNKTLKDILVRFLTMSGFDSPFVPGWDCHGLPIENKVQQRVIQSDREPSDVAAKTMRRLCYDEAVGWVKTQRDDFRRLGVLADWSRPYMTTDASYETVVMESLKNLVAKGFVTRCLKPVAWCVTDRTALAEAELEYREADASALYVSFPMVHSFPGTNYSCDAVAWTTTPWTLPANVALAVHPDAVYACVAGDDRDARLVIAADLVEGFSSKMGKSYKVVATCLGRDLGDRVYIHPLYNDNFDASPEEIRTARVVVASFVTATTGTGIVHIAPAHGYEDWELAAEKGLPVFCPVSEAGVYTAEAGKWFLGESVLGKRKSPDCPTLVGWIKFLLGRNMLHSETVRHSIPHCWRCGKPTIIRATPQWFLKVDHDGLRDRVLAAAESTTWVPAPARNRFEAMAASRPDWCLSRQREWGVAIPSLECPQCRHVFLSGETIDLRLAEPSDSTFRSNVLACPRCGFASLLKNGKDILDVWFESGVSHLAVVKDVDPSQVIVIEGSDQHRGWFQSSITLGVGIRGRSPFGTVITHGFVVDENGKKFSKSKGAPPVSPTLDQFGSDVVRLFVASSDYTSDLRVSAKSFQETAQAYNKIRNTFRFMLGNLRDFESPHSFRRGDECLQPVDRYVLHKTNELVRAVLGSYEKYQFCQVYHAVLSFCTVDLSSFYFEAVKDRLYADPLESDSGRAVRWVLAYVYSRLVRLVAPILPHTAEELWSYCSDVIVAQPGGLLTASSIFVEATMPEPEASFDLSPETVLTWDVLFGVRTAVMAGLERLRAAKRIGSSAQARIRVGSLNPAVEAVLADNLATLRDICVVSEATHEPGLEAEVVVEVSPEPKCERCWVRRGDVADGLCPRCRSAVAV